MKPTVVELSRLVGNPNVYAVQSDDGTAYRPVWEPLTLDVLKKHLAGAFTVGTYIGHAVEEGTVARTLVFDFDNPDLDVARGNTISVEAALVKLGVSKVHMGVEFSGRKGYHIWVLLANYHPSPELRRLGRAACFLAQWEGEVNPKQDVVTKLGNLVKLPGGVHRATGKLGEFVTSFPVPMSDAKWEEVMSGLPAEQVRARVVSDNRFPCMEHIQEEGAPVGARNDQLFHLATMLRRSGLTAENVALVLTATNDKMEDPLDDWELSNLLESSRNSGPLCSRLPSDTHCGELCVLERTSGLYSRPGALRWAAPGERVVVEVEEHQEDTTVTVSHPDAKAGKFSLRKLEKT